MERATNYQTEQPGAGSVETAPSIVTTKGKPMKELFEINFSWIYGLGQIAVYCAVIVSVLVILSKIDLPYRKEGDNNGNND